MISAEPPAAKPTITRTGLDGYVCACAIHETTGRAAQPVQIGAGRGSWRSHLECRGAAKCGPDASSAHANVKLHDPPVYPEGDVLPALDTKQTCRSVNGVSTFGGKPENIYSF